MAWEWKDIEPEQTENKPVANWQWKDVNIERMSVLDDDSGKMYSVPVTFDEQDIRFAIDTQEWKQPKENFIGKIKAVADDVWNVADAAAYGVEEVFKDAERGVVGFVGQATDAFLGYGRKNLMGDIHELENYDPKKYEDNGLFSNPKNAVFRNLSDEKRLEMIEKRKKMIEKINQTRTKWQKTFQKAQNILKKDENMTSMDKFVEGIGSGMASVGVSTATLLATKNPTVGASILAAGFGGMRNVEVFDKSIDAGMDFETAEKYGQIAGSIEGGIELALEPLYYSVANLKPVKQLTDRVIKQTLLKISETAVGRSVAKKITQHHTQSIIKQAAKGFMTEGSEEFLQDLSGMAFDNAIGLEKYSLNEMLSQSFMSFAIGGITGSGGAVVGTSIHNQRVIDNNKKIQNIIGKQYPELTVDEKNVMADALQEVFYQEESQYLDEFDKILNKENDPDTLPEGISKENMTVKTRQLLKNKYGMNDDQINKAIDVAITSIDLRNQFNEAYNQFFEQIVKTGADTKVADQASRIIAARASTVALNEKSTVKDVLERWSLRFAENEHGADNWNKIQNESKTRKDKKNELINVITQLKNTKTAKDNRLSLTQFLKKKGGLQDYGGELKNLDAAKSVIGLVNKNGLTLDDATMMAWENGYLNGAERPEINDLLNAVDKEIRGKKIYAAGGLISETEQENEALASWAQVFDEAGVDINEDINTIYEKMENYEKNEQIKSVEHKLMLSEADEERLSVMENNGLNRLQALEQLKNEKDNINLKQKDVEENLPFFQDESSQMLNEREDGPKIASDDTIVDVVSIPDDAVPDFKTRADLRSWLIGKFEEIGSVTIETTGEQVDFNKNAAKRVVKNSRNRNNNIAYPEIEKVVSGAQYSGFRNTDERHPNVRGQDVYHSGVIYKDVPYSVEFYVDVPLNKGGKNFAGNKIRQIKIEPQRYGFNPVAKEETSPKGSIHKISIAVLRGKVKPARYNNSDKILYQGQIAENGRSIELSIKSVEEMQGLSEEDFKNKMLDTLKSFKGNKIFNQSLNGDIEIRTSSIKKYKSFFADKNKRLIVPYIPELLAKAKFNKIENSYMSDKETNVKAYYKADLPINIDNDTYNVHLTVKEDNHGNLFWDAQVQGKSPSADPATNPGVKGLKPQHATPATNPGDTGLTSEVSEDTLIISPDRKKVNKTFEQSDISSQTGHRGQYDAANRIITLFSSADPSTIIHETAHFFLDDMRRFSDNPATAEQLQAIYKYVGSLDGSINREQHEYFARSFEAYLLEGKAPNNLLAKAFNKFRNWLSHIYGNIKKLNIDLDDNIRKTFDEMLGGKKLDFAMQISSQQLLDNVNSGYIPQSVINKALRLLENGKMSKADMETMIGKLKSGELKRDGVGKYLTDFEKSGKINHEQIFAYDKMRYRNQLEYGNVTKKQITDKIDRLLEWSKSRSQNGKLVGRFTDIKVNRFFDNIRENVALSKDEAIAKIADNMKLIDAITKGEEIGNISELVWQNKILSIPAKKANITLLADVYNAISDTYNAGRLTNAVTGEIKKAYRKRLINEVVNILDQGKGKDWRKNSSEMTKRLRRFGMNSFSWNGILDILSMYDKGSAAFKSKLNQNLGVFEEEKKMRIGVYNDGEVVSKLIGEALSGNKNHAISVSRYINKELPRKFEIEWNGNSKSFTKDELIDIYMKAKDPQTRQIMLDDKVLQFNEEFLARVDELITEDDAAVADALFKFYEQDYEKINVFYEQHYGISLGRSEFYSPRSMDRGGINVSTGDLRSYAGLSAIKQRKAKAGQIKPKGAFSVLQNHINNVNHYISFADKLQDINTVLGDPEIKNRIRNLFGEEMNRKIASEVSRFASNDRQFVEGVGKLMSKLRSNYAVSVLALKPALAIKQLTSFPAYWENLTTKEFFAGLADFAKNPKHAIEILGNSELMKTRGTNIIKDFEVVSSSEKFKNLGTKTGLREFLMMNIQLGDRGAIYMGGWAVYKSVLEKTGSHEKAIAEFERITNETQQSSYMSEQSKWQSNPFLNWFTMFQSSQNQYLRKELTALRGLITGRMPKDKVFKTLFIYHFLLPMLFQFVSDGFRWDKDTQLRAGMLGSLNGLFVLGKVMERLVDWSISGQLNYKLGIREVLPPLSVFENLGKFLNNSVKYAQDEIYLEDYIDALKGLAKTAGEATGLPVKYPMDIINNAKEYADDEEFGKLGLLMLGWSPYALRDLEEE